MMPAGLDFAGLDYSIRNQHVWISEIKGKQVTFTVYKNKAERTGNIQFLARPTMIGSFKSEGTYITNAAKPEITNKMEGGIMNIK